MNEFTVDIGSIVLHKAGEYPMLVTEISGDPHTHKVYATVVRYHPKEHEYRTEHYNIDELETSESRLKRNRDWDQYCQSTASLRPRPSGNSTLPFMN